MQRIRLYLTTGTCVTVAMGSTRANETWFANFADSLRDRSRDIRTFRRIGSNGVDMGPIAVDMTKVAYFEAASV